MGFTDTYLRYEIFEWIIITCILGGTAIASVGSAGLITGVIAAPVFVAIGLGGKILSKNDKSKKHG
jgi:hypothetical protein